MTLEGLRVVVDCGNGAAYKATPTVLRELGAEVFSFGVNPNGTNINLDCGSMHPDMMCQKVWEHRAHVGIAHDGDADRVLLCDERGKLIDGDDIMAISGLDMIQGSRLAKNTVVATVMSNAGLEAALQAAGGHLIRTPVGDKYVIDEMLQKGYCFGGEQSGHMIFGDHCTTGDGLVTALQVLRIMQTTGRPLSDLARCWTRFPQLVSNVKVREKRPFEELDGVMDLLKQAETDVAQAGGRVLLRYSGTEPKARLLIEGRDSHVIELWSRKITDCIRKHVGA
jgi:phosphoglucosamine mutase